MCRETTMEKDPKDSFLVTVFRDRTYGADVKAARISIITDEGHLEGVTISRAALEVLRSGIDRVLREMDEEES